MKAIIEHGSMLKGHDKLICLIPSLNIMWGNGELRIAFMWISIAYVLIISKTEKP
jgi:hypothetical protein